MKLEIVVRDTLEDQVRSSARFVAERLREAIAAHRAANLVLAGGTTPRSLYEELARRHARELDWTRVQVFLGDERCVPFTDQLSNYKMARESFVAPLAIPATHVHPMPAMQDDRDGAARAYEKEIRRFARDDASFDLVLLGIGEDGHCASLFPGAAGLAERERWVIAVDHAAKPPPQRLSLTLPAFAAAKCVLFLASGAAKAEALRRVLEPTTPEDRALPAALVRARDRVVWFVDRGAASALSAPR